MGDDKTMTDGRAFWIWLQSRLGIGLSVNSEAIVQYFGTAEELYHAGVFEWRLSNVFTPKQIEKLLNQDLSEAEQILQICQKNQYDIVTPDDERYPPMLFKLPNFPLVLYVNGDLDCLKNKIAIAVVGTREPTRNSVSVAGALNASMARAGAVIVSGGALGIDSASHTGALNAHGNTVAVLGCGLDADYLPANRALRHEIARNGAVITEYPPGTHALARNFPIRNRIIAGLAYGTVVIEAGVKSGSLITAQYAAQQGRDVYAVPGDLLSSKFSGANKLIQDGAKPVFSAMDVLADYASVYPEMIDAAKIETELYMKTYEDPPSARPIEDNPRKQKKGAIQFIPFDAPPLLSENAKKIYFAFDSEEMHSEELIIKTALDAGSFSSAITELELLGIIESRPGRTYVLHNK